MSKRKRKKSLTKRKDYHEPIKPLKGTYWAAIEKANAWSRWKSDREMWRYERRD